MNKIVLFWVILIGYCCLQSGDYKAYIPRMSKFENFEVLPSSDVPNNNYF